jgi:hypothetical protein
MQMPKGGQAQPQQPQPQGTPYNPQQGQPFGAWSPQPAQSANAQQPSGWSPPSGSMLDQALRDRASLGTTNQPGVWGGAAGSQAMQPPPPQSASGLQSPQGPAFGAATSPHPPAQPMTEDMFLRRQRRMYMNADWEVDPFGSYEDYLAHFYSPEGQAGRKRPLGGS